MNDERLRELLSNAETRALPPIVSKGLAQRVRVEAGRRRAARRFAASATVAIVVILATSILLSHHRARRLAVGRASKAMCLRAEVVQCEQEAQERLLVVNYLLADEAAQRQRLAARRKAVQPSARTMVEAECDQMTMLTVHRTGRLMQRSSRPLGG